MHLGLGTSHRLAKRKQQRQIGADAALLQLLCGFNTLPSSSDFDQNAPGVYAFGLVKRNDAFSACQRGVSIKT